MSDKLDNDLISMGTMLNEPKSTNNNVTINDFEILEKIGKGLCG